MKIFDELVTQKLGEILIQHGRAPLTDARLCENFLKDYCPEFKEEISILVQAVGDRVAIDLLVSQDGLPPHILRSLLIARLCKNRSLDETAARWAVRSWTRAIEALSRAESERPQDANLDLDGPISARSLDRHEELAVSSNASIDLGVLGRSEQAIRTVSVSPYEDWIGAAGDDSTIRLWHARTGEMRVLGKCAGPVLAVAFSPNGVSLASASDGQGGAKPIIQLWDLESAEAEELGQCGRRATSLVYSPGGKSLASGSAEPGGVLRVWNLQTGQMRVLKGPQVGPSSIAFAPDGESIAAADGALSQASIRLWNLESGTATILGHSSRQIPAVAFSPDGKMLASGSWDETVRLWNVRTREAQLLADNCACVCCLAFSSRGDKLAACSLDSGIRVWELATGRSRTIGECDQVNAVAFSIDGTLLVTGSGDGTVRLWDASV